MQKYNYIQLSGYLVQVEGFACGYNANLKEPRTCEKVQTVATGVCILVQQKTCAFKF